MSRPYKLFFTLVLNGDEITRREYDFEAPDMEGIMDALQAHAEAQLSIKLTEEERRSFRKGYPVSRGYDVFIMDSTREG